MDPAEFAPHLYERAGQAAVLTSVSRSLEPRFHDRRRAPNSRPGQRSLCYCPRGRCRRSPQLDLLLTRAFAVAKRVRTETAAGSTAVSVASVAVELAKKIFGSLQGKQVYLVGAGRLAARPARHLLAHGARRLFSSPTAPRAGRAFAAKFGGEAIRFEELYKTYTSSLISSYTPRPVHLMRFSAASAENCSSAAAKAAHVFY